MRYFSVLTSLGSLAVLAFACHASDQTPTIQQIEINQALGKQLNGNLKFVAGKDTVIRAFLGDEVVVDPEQTKARIVRDGNEVAVIQPRSYDKPTKIVDYLCSTRAACGNWEAGSYTFEVTVNGVSHSTAGTEYNFVTREKLRLLVVPIKANRRGEIDTFSDEKWKTMWQYTSSVYPLAADAIAWDIKDEFDATDPMYDLETDAGQTALLKALAALIPPHCSVNPKGEGCYELVVGFVPKTFGGLQGLAMRPATLTVASDEDAAATVAHEIAHTFGIGDTYDGGTLNCGVNPAPDGYRGGSWEDPSVKTSCTAGRVAFPGASATLVPETQHPYEVGGRGALGNVADYMGTGAKMADNWTSQEVYNHLFDRLAPGAAKPDALRVRSAGVAQRIVDFSGSISANGQVAFDPWVAFDSTETPVNTTGTYTLRAVGANGTVLATQKLDVKFWSGSNPPKPLDPAPFQGAIPFPSGTARFEVVKGTSVIGTLAVSANDPVLSNVAAAVQGQTLSGPYKLTWSGSDKDGDKLTYIVEFNADITKADSPWEVLNGSVAQAEWQEDFSELPGGNHAQVRITATDGLRTVSATSPEFKVPFKAPEVFINPPEWGQSYELGDQVELEAEAYDLQDEWLPDANLEWKSNISGVLGHGTRLITDKLAAGEHIITVTAANSAGMKVSDSLTVTIGNVTNHLIEPSTPGVVTITNNYKGLNTSIAIDGAAITANSFVSFEATSEPASPTPPAGVSFAGRNFNLSLASEQGDDWKDVAAVASGITLTLDYSAEAAKETLRLFRWNEETHKWVDAATECQPGGSYDTTTPGKLVVKVCSLGQFALAGVLAPRLSQGSIYNAASYATDGVAPGSLISIFGGEFTAARQDPSPVPLPTEIAGTSVLINGVAAPLMYVDPGQINAQVPFETAPGTATVVVVKNGMRSPARTIQVNATAPGIFLYGKDRALAVNHDTGDVNSTASGVKAGRYLVLYMTGQGAVDNPVANGAAAKVSPLSRATASVRATIGGKDADVLFAGLAPNYVGLLQVNLKVPEVAAGDQPLVVTIGQAVSNTAVVTVK